MTLFNASTLLTCRQKNLIKFGLLFALKVLIEVKKILIPTDFSANADNAAKYAVELLLPFEAIFYLLHTYERPVTGGSSLPGIEEIVHQEKVKNLEEKKKKLASLFPGMRHRYEIIALNSPTEAGITSTIKKRNINMVVMGTKGATGIKESLLGSNTAKVLRLLGCSLLTVPPEFKLKSYSTVSIASDFAGVNTESEFELLSDFLQHYDPRLILLSFSSQKVNKSSQENWNKVFGEFELEYELYKDTGPAEINSLVQEHSPELLVMVSRHEGSINQVLRKSAAKTHGLRFQLPILIIHDN